MANTTDFNEEDDDIFPDEDISQYPPGKGNRFIPDWIMGDFLSWLALYHSEILMLRGIPLSQLKDLIDEFEYFSNCNYGFPVRAWKDSLERR